jgi:outer membrane protein assembly complex protein YaeT
MAHRLGRWLLRSCLVGALGLLPALPTVVHAQEVECDQKGETEVRKLKFTGNQTFSADELSARVYTTPSSFTHRYFGWFFNAGSKRCLPDPGGLGTDTLSLKQFYLNNGFYDTKVDTAVTAVGSGKVDVTFRIDEGAPIRLDTLRIVGLDSVPERDDILHDLQLRPGGRFGRVLLYSDIDTIRVRLRNAGYPHADVFPSYEVNRLEHAATAELQVSPGLLAHFGRIDVTSASVADGTPEIDSTVVRRLLGFKTGETYSDRAITDAQRNLYNLGAFRHVGVTADTVSQHGDSVADVLVDLREDYMREFDLEEGWATLDCFRTNATYTDKNFLSNAHHIELTGRLSKIGYGAPTSSRATRNLCYRPSLDNDSIASSKLNYYAGATLREPTLFGTHWVPSYSAYTERRGEYRAYLRTTYFGFDASATRNLGAGLPFRGGYTLEYGQTEAQPAYLCVVFSRCDEQTQKDIQRPLRLAVASASIQRIRLDNTVDPRTGTVLGGEFRFAAPFTGSDPSQSFAKATMDASWYVPLRSHVVFATRLRAGAIGATHLPPPQERLYAGGANSVRGFQQNEVGSVVYLLDSVAVRPTKIDDTTYVFTSVPGQPNRRIVPVGGNTLLVANAELRVRDPFFPDLLQYVLFTDAGQVWTRQAGDRHLGFTSLLVTPGVGLRVFSPIGPISVNAGYNPYKSISGQAFFPSAVDQFGKGKAPLICVTAPGDTPVPLFIHKNGDIEQDIASCPSSFAPSQSTNFLSRFKLTLSIGTAF